MYYYISRTINFNDFNYFIALWTRLSDRLILPLPLPEQLCSQVWCYVKASKEIEIYELPEERNRFVLFDRYELVDPLLGTVMEPVCLIALIKAIA